MGRHIEYSHNTITIGNPILARKHGQDVAAVLPRAQLYALHLSYRKRQRHSIHIYIYCKCNSAILMEIIPPYCTSCLGRCRSDTESPRDTRHTFIYTYTVEALFVAIFRLKINSVLIGFVIICQCNNVKRLHVSLLNL